jgi:glycosyltransferase involved in cell wall biosynthesis
MARVLVARASKYEPFGLATVEATTSDCPAVVSNNIGALDKNFDGKGYLIANNIADYIKYCIMILSDEEYKRKLIAEGRSSIIARYNVANMHHNYEKLLHYY